MGRYAVRRETRSILGIIEPASPHVGYSYYRWRWMAKFSASLDNWTPVFMGCITTATYLGRVCLKPRTPLQSGNAQNILVQGRNRRDVASRVLPAYADIQAEEQSGERK